MDKKKVLNLNRKAKKAILEELWEDSVFNNQTYSMLEYIADQQSKKTDPDNIEFPENVYSALATSRNRYLITSRQQDILKNITIGVFGLSVGSHAAVTWMMESWANCMKIIDPDIISPTNLNRLRVGWENVGRFKVEVVKEQLLDINPFAKIVTYDGKEIEKVRQLFDVEPRLNLVVDSIDDMNGKIILRRFAKQRKIPLVSAADVGDNITLDIERYDEVPQPEMFLGRVPDFERKDYTKLTDLEKRKVIIDLVGFEKNSEEMLESLLELGESLGTWPQLGATATMAGGILTTTIKKIFLGEKVKSGRYFICLDDILVSDFNNLQREQNRSRKVKKVREKFNID